jgi:hypothetical protein
MQVTSPFSKFTRPADTTAYASGDLVANSTTAGSVTPLSWDVKIGARFKIKRATILKSTTSVTNFKLYLHLFSAAPTFTNGDNGALSMTTGAAGYLGSVLIDGTTLPGAVFSDGAIGTGAFADGAEPNFQLPSGHKIYGVLQANAAYTPGNAEVFTVTLDLQEHRG